MSLSLQVQWGQCCPLLRVLGTMKSMHGSGWTMPRLGETSCLEVAACEKEMLFWGPLAPWIDLLKPYGWFMLSRSRLERRGQDSPLPEFQSVSLDPHFDGSFRRCPVKARSPSPLPHFPSLSLPPFLLFLPCKDNQVYVKYVCSFDSPRYLINSITPNAIVPKVFEMPVGNGGLF